MDDEDEDETSTLLNRHRDYGCIDTSSSNSSTVTVSFVSSISEFHGLVRFL